MVTPSDIQALADQIAREFRPRKIILFGSRAYGAPRPDSDVDLLVILPFQGSALSLELRILERASPRFAVDLLAQTPEEAAERYRYGDPLVREALDRGRVLYEAAA